jgi:hypothetical protein
MSKHLTAQAAELYQQQRLAAEELLETDAHLSACAACREQLKAREGTRGALEELRADLKLQAQEEPAHPGYAQFTAYAANELDEVDREIMDSHLEFCAQCTEVMQDLRAFVAVPQPAAVVARERVESISWQERLAALWNSRMEWMSWQFAGAAAAILLLAGITAAVWFSLRSASNRVELARVTPSPVMAETPRPSATIAAAPTPAAPETVASPNVNTNAAPVFPQKGEVPVSNSASKPVDSATVALKDGRSVITVDASGNVSGLDTLSEAERQAVSKAVTSEKVEAPSTLATIAGSLAVLRGGPSEGISFPIVSPVGVVVVSEQPSLRWGALDGATSYTVSIFDRNFKRVARSAPLSGTQWTVDTPLARGAVYTWQVTAIKDGQEITSPEAPAPEARFMVLDKAQAENIRRAKAAYEGSHLTLGTLYARAGLLDDAEREFQLLVRDNPKSSLARKLLQSVRALKNSK